MQVDPAVDVASAVLPGVQEHGGELDAKVQVVGAAAPLPAIPRASASPGEGTGFTPTGQQGALTARPSHAVGHAGSRDGVRKGRLSVAWNKDCNHREY